MGYMATPLFSNHSQDRMDYQYLTWALDYLIVDSQTMEEVNSMDMDEEKIAYPFHSVIEGGKSRIICSGHNPITAEFAAKISRS